MASSSSSSPTMKKPTKVQQTFKKLNAFSSSKATSLIKRQETVFKKAYQLSVLCGIQVCVICYGSDGELKTWPEDREKVEDIARRYSELSKTRRRKGSVDLHEFVEKINKDDAKKNKMKKVRRVPQVKYPVWDQRFDNYSVEQLTELIQSLERNLTRFQHRIDALVMSQRQRKIHNTNMANQELMMTTTMNHLQQHPNQVSMFLVNHANGSFSRIPVSSSSMNSQSPVSASSLNQAQSLAPIPPGLTIYPNSNVGNYSSLLGVQDTGINGFQNVNMLTYNNNNNVNVNDFSKQIDQNSKVENYSRLLGVEGCGVNEFENTNMYSSNNSLNAEDYSGFRANALQSMNIYNNNIINANGLSHQVGQFPTETAAPSFQFGSVRQQY